MRTKSPIQILVACLVVFAALFVVGCGGSGGNNSYTQTPTTPNQGGASFTLAGGGSATTQPGANALYTVTVSSIQNPGNAQGVDLSVSGLPNGVTATFDQNPVPITAGSTTVNLTVTTPAALENGSYSFTISGRLGSVTRTLAGTLVVDDGLILNVSGGGTSSAPVGGTATFNVFAQLVPDHQQLTRAPRTVNLSVIGLPQGAQATFSANPITATEEGASSTLSVTVPNDNQGSLTRATAPGEYPFTIRATSGGQTIDVAATLVVEQESGFDFTVSGAGQFDVFRPGTDIMLGTLTLMEGNTRTAPVTISVEGLPQGITATVSPNPINPESLVTTFEVTFETTEAASFGTFPVTIEGRSGSIVRSYTVNLRVRQPV